MDYISKIFLENATNFKDYSEVVALTESEKGNLNSTMVTNLYQSAINKGFVDFDTIPDSKGIITQYEGYNNMMECLNLLLELSSKGNIRVSDIDEVITAITNIEGHGTMYERGFTMGKDFIMMQYNVLVSACVEATSLLISSYVDFIRKVDKTEITIVRNTKTSDYLSLQCLKQFNESVKTGEYVKMLDTVLKNDVEELTGTEVMITTLIIGALMSIIPVTRELIFYFYHSRMKMHDYLEHQAFLLEVNKNNIQNDASRLPAKKKNEIVKKQDEIIKKLHKLSDRVKVNHSVSKDKTMKDLKSENKSWTLGSVTGQTNNNNMSVNAGFQLI